MEVPILVALTSLAGTIVGGGIVIGGNYFLARRREKLEFRTACRLITVDLQYARLLVTRALVTKLWWRPDEELTTEGWKQYKNVLAPYLSYDAWNDVWMAVGEINHVNLLAAAPRQPDRTQEIFLDETVKALTVLLTIIETGRVRLLPHL
jgi:hypothetical protein